MKDSTHPPPFAPPLGRVPGPKGSRTTLVAIVAGLAATALASACSSESRAVNVGYAPEQPGFMTPDASVDGAALDGERKFTSYCPSNECPANRTTCPGSLFLCDVDLASDLRNCGACGNYCPSPANNEVYVCVEGRCLVGCRNGAQDCDGLPDNGCEISAIDDEHCGGCGKACSDPAKPCLERSKVDGVTDIGCGCLVDELYCATPYPHCVDARLDNENCGACGRVCDPNEGGPPPHETTHMGCYGGKCGQVKCNDGLANCDGDVHNGCETSVLTDENCGGCGLACAPGQKCRLDLEGYPTCMCSPGLTFCAAACSEDLCQGRCLNLSSDPDHCGGCGQECPRSPNALSAPICAYGTCKSECVPGWADCDGNEGDDLDCEVNTQSDPMNCGGCGKTCDGVAGQACVLGRCVVKPCDEPVQDAGEIPR